MPDSAPRRATLLPCPFCGGEAYQTRAVNGSEMFYVGCASCGVALKAAWYRDQPTPTKDIVQAWNQRAAVPSSGGALTQLRSITLDLLDLNAIYQILDELKGTDPEWRGVLDTLSAEIHRTDPPSSGGAPPKDWRTDKLVLDARRHTQNRILTLAMLRVGGAKPEAHAQAQEDVDDAFDAVCSAVAACASAPPQQEIECPVCHYIWDHISENVR